jgi:peptide deformylase
MYTIVTGAETPVLHAKNEAIKDPLAPEIQALLPVMADIMRKADGIGLAAPQIGINKMLCVVEIEGVLRNFINPKITARSTEKIVFEEGCLSLPKEFFPIERSESITVRYVDETGTNQKLRLRGLWAICLQHELDHLDGILIADRYKKQRTKSTYVL